MRKLGTLAFAGATTGIALFAACGTADNSSSSSSGNASGSSGSSGSNGSSGNASSSSGSTSSSSGGMNDAAIMDATLVCNVLDAGFDASSIDAAALVCAPGQWRDFAASTCRTCPASPVTCSTLLRGALDAGTNGSPFWQKNAGTTQTITTTVADGAAQVVYATATVQVGSCYTGATPMVVATVNAPVSIQGNTLTSTFSVTPTDSGSQYTPCGTITYTLIDACCQTQTVRVNLVTDQETTNQIISRACPDGG